MVRLRYVLALLVFPLVASGQSSTSTVAPSVAAPSTAAPATAAANPPLRSDRPVLLDFWLPTCGPCRDMDPVVARLHQEGFDVRKVDGSRLPDAATRYGVQRYPTFVLLSGGREVWRVEGKVDYNVLRTSLLNATPKQTKPPIALGAATAPVGSSSRPAAQNASFQLGTDRGPAGPTAEQLLAASVRIRVEDPQGRAFGTGTIIDSRQGEALVLTCGHLFRDQTSQAPVTIELFAVAGGAPRVVDRAPGQVVAVDLENDVALVSLRPNRPVTVRRVAESLAAVTAGAPVWSVGCDLGADPTVRTSQVIGVNRTHRPPNITSTGAPVQGRSGGGLFNAAGDLIGVCFGADEKLNEGLYADLVSIHAQLDQVGLREIYQRPAAELATQPTTAPLSTVATAATPIPASQLTPVAPPIMRAQNSPAATFGLASPPSAADNFRLAQLSAAERANLEELSRRAESSEVICIVRPKTPGGKSEVIALDDVSPAFLQALESMRGPVK